MGNNAMNERLLELIRQEPTDEIWQEAIRVSDWVYAGQPLKEVFELTLRALDIAKHDDTIDALSTCLIEHLLEKDFSLFDRIEQRINEGDDKLLYALSLCRKYGLSKVDQNSRRWDLLIQRNRKRLTRISSPFSEPL
jgi:hypothetical protein